MRHRVDYGIDLGTTNSAVARLDDGRPTIKKSDVFQMDTTPSAVGWRKGRTRVGILVGIQARAMAQSGWVEAVKTREHRPNAFVEFKREMGTQTRYTPAVDAGREWSPEQLSSEVLKALARYSSIGEPVRCAVITIPAAFNAQKQQATQRAAELAGFAYTQVLQEPMAAIYAYGLATKREHGKYLVFDFGGGTFDAALVLVEDGVMSVKDTEGDNYLGGKDLDEAVVDRILLPQIRNEVDLGHPVLDDPIRRGFLREALRKWAEEIIIQLSGQTSYQFLPDVDDRLGDILGIDPDFEVTRDQLRPVVVPTLDHAVRKAQALLGRNGLSGRDLDDLILVGGPTLSPILREMVAEKLRPPNASVDPMTVVARGAAVFAGTVGVPRDLAQVAVAGRDGASDVLQLDLQYESTSVQDTEFVAIRAQSPADLDTHRGLNVELHREGWRSGRQPLLRNGALVEVKLERRVANVFALVVTNDRGDAIQTEPAKFTINQGLRVAGSPLNLTLGVEVWDSGRDKRVFQPLRGAEKNRLLPVIGVAENLKTPSVIRPGVASDELRISVYATAEAHAAGIPVAVCELLCDFTLRGSRLTELIPADSRFQLHVETGETGPAPTRVSLMFEALDNPDVELEEFDLNTEGPSPAWAHRELEQARELVSRLSDTGFVDVAALDRVFEEVQTHAGIVQDDAAVLGERHKAASRLREALRQLDLIEDRQAWPAMEAELDAAYEGLSKVARKRDSPEATEHMADIGRRLAEVRKSGDRKLAKELLREMGAAEAEWGYLERLVGLVMYASVNFASIPWTDRVEARRAVDEAMHCLKARRPVAELHPRARRILELMDREKADKASLPGRGIPWI